MDTGPHEDPRDGMEFVDSMPKRDFHERFIRGVCRTREFGALVTLWAENITVEDRRKVRTALAEAGVPPEMMGSDEELDAMAAAVAARSVRVL